MQIFSNPKSKNLLKMGQKHSKHRKSDLTFNFSEYYGSKTTESHCQTSPTLPSFGYIKSRPLNLDPKKLSIDQNLMHNSTPVLHTNSSTLNIEPPCFKNAPSNFTSRTPSLIKSAFTNSSIDLHSISKKPIFEIKNVFQAEKFQTHNPNRNSFFKKLTKRIEDSNSKISLNDMLNYKPGRRIFFTHVQQTPKMKNPFEEIRVPPPLENDRKSCFKDDMALKSGKDDKITPEERNMPSPYYQIRSENPKKIDSEEKIDILLLDSEENMEHERDKLVKTADSLIDKIKEANEASLEGFEKIYEDYENEYRLQIFMKTYVSKEKNRINIFRNQFIVPCAPETFLRFMNNIEDQAKIDTHLDKFYIIKELKTDINVIYLSYKKVLITSPRELIYVKAIKEINKEQNIWCDASQSILYVGFPLKKEMVRGEIILSGHCVSPLEGDSGKSIVRLYSEVDFKTNVPTFMSKSFSMNEMKKYTGDCIRKIKEMNGG